jgi:hypothetical protein
MKIFIAYASEDKTVAESIAFSIRGRDHKVFFDRDDLPVGASFDRQIERAVKQSDLFIFLISPDSVASGAYTLTELAFARKKWPDPNGRVLPVMVRQTPLTEVSPYLSTVTILEARGNIAAETSAAVDGMSNHWSLQTTIIVSCIASVLSIFTFQAYIINWEEPRWAHNFDQFGVLYLVPALISGIMAGVALRAARDRDRDSVLIILGSGILYTVITSLYIIGTGHSPSVIPIAIHCLSWSVGFAVFYYSIAFAFGDRAFIFQESSLAENRPARR